MPELPEVETIRRGLRPSITGRAVRRAGSHSSAKFTPARDLVGARFTDIRRRGKYLIFATDRDIELVAHLGMTGSFGFGPGLDDPHLRAWWELDDDQTLGFRDIRRFGRLRVVAAGDYAGIPTLATMGPEPLHDDFTAEGLYDRLRASGRMVKTQLLSQRPVAGLGNIYADEALWWAGVAPHRRRIGRQAAAILHHAIVTVITQGIENGGTTLRDYRNADGGTGANQHELQCYGRADEPCARCGEPLRRRVIDARTTTWCRTCQR